MSVSLQAVSPKTVFPKTFFFVQKKLRKMFRLILFFIFHEIYDVLKLPRMVRI